MNNDEAVRENKLLSDLRSRVPDFLFSSRIDCNQKGTRFNVCWVGAAGLSEPPCFPFSLPNRIFLTQKFQKCVNFIRNVTPLRLIQAWKCKPHLAAHLHQPITRKFPHPQPLEPSLHPHLLMHWQIVDWQQVYHSLSVLTRKMNKLLHRSQMLPPHLDWCKSHAPKEPKAHGLF